MSGVKLESLAPLQIHGITIEPGKWKASVEGRPISLTSYQFRLLHLLANNAGKVLTRQRNRSRPGGVLWGKLIWT